MYAQRDLEVPSCNNCCSGKAGSITNSEFVCSLRYPACNAPYYIFICGLSDCRIFSHFSCKRYDLKKVIAQKMCVLIFSTTFVWNIYHSKKKWARYDQKSIWVFMWSTLYACPVLKKIEFSRQIFEKQSNTKLHENPFSGSRLVPCVRTDRRTWWG